MKNVTHANSCEMEKMPSEVQLECESSLTGVCPAVCFEVGAFGVHFVAAGEVASMDSPLLQCVRRFSRERVLCGRVNYY